ncbi:MAG: ribosome assembly RNA-binding protein YhbY [Firmicutes bacterium]|jgi:RNA-binding protein|nr:ribosome assembly RNA-binding protein YhbY [Bacillota bacterium]
MLTSKQRAYLRSLGNELEPIFQVGKGGLTAESLFQIGEALKARELVKVRVLKNCLDEPREVAEEIAGSLEADLVQVIGRNFLLYKRSEDKAKIELP